MNINEEKSTLNPVSSIEWLGMQVIMNPISPSDMLIVNTKEKKEEIRRRATLINPNKASKKGYAFQKGMISLKKLLNFVGLASFMAQIVKSARWYINAILSAIPTEYMKSTVKGNVLIPFTRDLRAAIFKTVRLLETNASF